MNDPRTPISTDVAHDLREMFGEEFGLFFVEVPPAPETTQSGSGTGAFR